MGIEAEFGCLSCKKNIWVGSMKPYKWKGFQIPNKDIFRFLSLHSKNKNSNCKLNFNHDATEEDSPWDEEIDINKEWQEDINSRSFWNSYSEEGTICGNCKKLIKDKKGKQITPNALEKNSHSWYCNETCFEDFRKLYKDKWDTIIYDSTKDRNVKSNSEIIEIGCTKCKIYTIINGQKDESGIIKDYEYFHLFLTEHSFHKDLIVFIENDIKDEIPWKDDSWKEHVY